VDITNKRNQKRVRVNLPVYIYDILNNKNYTGKVVDISMGGVSIVAEEELPVNTPVSLTFTFENIVYKRISADIVREVKKKKEKYFGSAFFDLSPQAKRQLEDAIKKVHSKKIKGLQKETIYNIYS